MVQSFNRVGFRFVSKEIKEELIILEAQRRKILLDHENEIGQKRHALWLTCGDDNSKKLHQYANYIKNVNSICKIIDDNGVEVESFVDMVEVGINYFENNFKEENISLNDIIHIA